MLALHTAIIVGITLVVIAVPVAAVVLLVIYVVRRTRQPATPTDDTGSGQPHQQP